MTTASDAAGLVHDLRNLPGSQPLYRALERIEALAPGAVAVLLMPAGLPVRLLTLLSARGLAVRVDHLADGFRINVRRPDIGQLRRAATR